VKKITVSGTYNGRNPILVLRDKKSYRKNMAYNPNATVL